MHERVGSRPSHVSRRRRILEQNGDVDIDQVSRLGRVVAKPCLKNSLEIRELQAVTLVTYLVPKKNDMVQATVDATKAYADSVAEANKITAERERQSRLEQVGAAHAHHWAVDVRVAAASTSLTEEERAQVVAHISAIPTPEQVTEIIYVSKSKKAYDKRRIKMQFGNTTVAVQRVRQDRAVSKKSSPSSSTSTSTSSPSPSPSSPSPPSPSPSPSPSACFSQG